ncbi:Gmad2 immunoglobulin-like domain-containing protein [Jiangella ureilytica]|uniref:Gmad2 immunoglobulin-like domain-containing protein n=1 Tax=Jiangella ureilytica TaxID=2530374 RepID=UPI0013A5DF86|nr:Gmad2 immunoglobulin-like domain-containing protein [Jiangella ureilytica]
MNTPEENWTPEERRLHDALERAAERVEPGPDGLARIRRRTAVVPIWRRPVVIGLAGATGLAAAVLVGGAIALNGSDDDTPVATTTSSSPASETPTTPPPATTPPADTTPPVQTLTVPVYYAADSGDGLRLTREFHTVETSLSPIAAAVHEMLAAPPADPDYATLWAPGAEVVAGEVGEGFIGVDLTGTPSLDATDSADLALQQLVYTATAAAANAGLDGSLPVRITVDGAPVERLFDAVDAAEPVGRADPLEVRQLVQINEPGEGATVSGPVDVQGEAAAFEANVLWELRRDGEVVDSGNTSTTECCTFAPFDLQLGDLEPGTYELVMSEDDPSGGEGRPPTSDSRTFTVE